MKTKFFILLSIIASLYGCTNEDFSTETSVTRGRNQMNGIVAQPNPLRLCPFKSQTRRGAVMEVLFFPGSVSWVKPDHAAISDNTYATADFFGNCSDEPSNTLRMYNLGFNIPQGATIKGIEVTIEKSRKFLIAGGVKSVVDNFLFLNSPKTGSSDSRADQVNDWPTADNFFVYGGCNDSWWSNNTIWTSTDINDPDFGLFFGVINQSCLFFPEDEYVSAYVDDMSITVYYLL